MKSFKVCEGGYEIIFIYNESLLNIYTRNQESKEKEEPQFVNLKLTFEKSLEKYINDFEDLIDQINQGKIIIDIKENFTNIKHLDLNISKNNNNNVPEVIISRKIYTFNVEYYLTKALNTKE